MIVYSGTKKQFITDVIENQIEKRILSSFVREVGYSTGKKEVESWRNSMMYMNNIVSDPEIPENVGIAIEYKIPQTSKRIDFILTGTNFDKQRTAVLIELKQWSSGVYVTDKDAVVQTDFFGEVNHPSYQVWSYSVLLKDYNSSIQDLNIELKPCAYLHNYESEDIIKNQFYKEYLDKAPIFLRNEALKLRDFIKKFVKYGDEGETLYCIENGKIRPSKSLADSLASMLDGKQEFVLIDDQKVVFETALKLAKISDENNKNVLIVEGGPGTGKTVVAINLLSELTNRKQVVQYVTKNSAPREVYQVKLTGKFTKTRISNLFNSSGSYFNIDANTFDTLVVDEAHRLNEKSGLFSHLGENQVKELINVSKFSVFFIDEDQRVTLKDIGEKKEIERWAKHFGANVSTLQLASQFRCNGSDGYLAWLDNILQIKETANDTLDNTPYDFQVINNPSKLHERISELNKENNKSRMVAGYCWKWVSKKNSKLSDIKIGNYEATWNLNQHGQAWIVHPDSVTEVGCIHTCQGLELDYVGVIIGPDMVVRKGRIITDATKRASTDKSMHGYKKLLNEDSIMAKGLADMIIKNTYRTLMTRGMKGCYVFSTDPETQEYFRTRIFSGEKTKKLLYGAVDSGLTVHLEN